ncbi:MAG TPA: SDR family oxidoreductase [Polyangiaceae bacterium LLY-WYZ-15_(1-7)]|nr:SDR family oxidoreductase [Polyangiaceae bacterium LLY-WYZ-15_(1-7)]HJL05639.1 SDR family oxidoreductase [Polyangiaceae bacterium LLY-WYZ-15_(1-7)]HJL08027.1 SDR family oxidoreductase [Polyangiaceae bacterium LLY-WYZ-15_(1-7)]HJL25956.1 SDR family oxidoreductase [Polyangiaceae bacterium LLY-WYZ-15_(1-7)]HJL30566.1 SDR family oxidoreductase [Polyangiaceae bacterium LLY-WYZ-15_(1-7)]
MGHALVTGASRGMGLEWCRQLARRGDRVVLTARSAGKAEAAAARLAEEGLEVLPRVLDVGDEASMAALAGRLREELGHLDLVVNNAGINPKDAKAPGVFESTFQLAKLDPDEVLRCIRLNGVMPVVLVKHLLPLLEAAEQPLVLSISSWLGSIGAKTMGGHYGYATSKAALNMMNRAMALQLKEKGVAAVVVNPGWVQTDMGGAKAELTPERAIGGMIANVVEKVGLEETGEFFQWDGSRHPW